MRGTKCDVVRQEEKESGKHLACRRSFCFYWILHGREGREEQFYTRRQRSDRALSGYEGRKAEKLKAQTISKYENLILNN